MSLRILMGIPASGATSGGPALHLPMLVADLRQQGFTVETFPYGRWAEGESWWEKIWRQAVDLLRFPARVRRTRPDLIHLNSALDRRALVRDVPFTLLARLLSCPVVLKWHGSYTEVLCSGFPWGQACQVLLRNLDMLCVLSEQERGDVIEAGHHVQCEVVNNGLELSRYSKYRDVRIRLGVKPETRLLLFIARLIPTKGLRDTLKAFQQVHEEYDADLVVIGDGPELRPAQQLCEELGIRSRVHFEGRLSELEALDYYCGCDILVFPTFHAEGFPMSIFQAVAGGMGIITTRIRAAADHLREPDNVLFVPPRDPASTAAAIRQLLQDPALLAKMRNNNRQLAQRFDRRRVAEQFGEIYRSLGNQAGDTNHQ